LIVYYIIVMIESIVYDVDDVVLKKKIRYERRGVFINEKIQSIMDSPDVFYLLCSDVGDT